MIKVAVIGGPILSGGKKNLIMEYFRHIDKTQVPPMFFSTAVTLEASAWELGHFINLDDGSSALAEKIIPVVEKNISICISHAKAMTDAEKLIKILYG